MTLRSRLADRPSPSVEIAKVFGPGTPASFREGEIASQMTPSSPFSPGQPIGPYDGYDRTPRSRDFATGYNIATRPRLHERVSFETLSGLIDAYDVAQTCIRHRIASVRSLDWKLISADGYSGDVTEAIAVGKAALKRPDRKILFKSWLAKYLWDVLAYDAGTLYRMRNRGGKAVGLKVIDGRTIAPLLDYWGDSPGDGAEAYVQFANGLPWNWLTRDDLIYETFDPIPGSAYGRAPIETVVLNANTDLRFQVYFLQRYTEGNIPAAFASSPETWSPDQIEQFQAYWDSFMYGDQSRKHQIRWMPGGSKIAWSNEKDFSDVFSLFMMRKTCLDEQTEILTRRGWVQFPKLADGDEVATRSADGRFEWQQPTDYIAEPYLGDMVEFKSNSLDLLVTPDHRMLLTYFPTSKHPRPKEFIKTAGEILGKGGYQIPMRSRWEGRRPETFVLPGLSYEVPDRGGRTSHTTVRPDLEIPMETWVAFLGLWLAEGHAHGSKGGSAEKPGKYRVGIAQAAESPYFDEIQALLDSLPFRWQRGHHGWVCQDMRLHAYLAPLGNSHTKYIPEDVKDLAPALLEILWAWACKGDGNHYLGKFWHMITASERLAGDWQEVLQKLGQDGSVSLRPRRGRSVIRGQEVNGGDVWIVRSRTSPLRGAHGRLTLYGGMVYCVTVPNGVIYVRRNGRPAWVGNCAAYHVVPSDLGFTQDVNRSSGESQADVQHKVGDLPLAHHVQDILSAFLQDDLTLPLQFVFDLGEEQDDRYQQAQADQVYMDRAVVSVSEIREMRYGLSEPAGTVVPRVFFTERAGPIPLSSLEAVSGPVDTQTAAPAPGAPLPHEVFGGTPGVIPEPPIKVESLAEREFGPKAMPPAPPSQPVETKPEPLVIAKEGEGAAGITAGTSIYGDPLIRDDEDDEDDDREAAVKSELAAFRRFERGRRKAADWRDFRFEVTDPVTAHNLNDGGRLAVRKAAGEIAVAGLAVLAADTGRVLMLQRALCDDDPAAGTWEFAGGHLEAGESPLAAAWREWAEECGVVPPPGVQTGSWTSGIYQGIVWTVESEAMVPVRSATAITNPDDPDGDSIEAIAWWNPADLCGNPAVRPELQADIDAVMAALGCTPDCCGAECCQDGCCNGAGGCTCGAHARPSDGDESVCPCGTPVVYDEMNGWQHGDGSVSHDDGESVSDKMGAVAKAAELPKWPGWDRDLTAAGHWAALLVAALTGAVGKTRAQEMASTWIREHPEGPGGDQGKREAVEAASAWVGGWLASQQIDLAGTCQEPVRGIVADGWLIGAVSAASLADGAAPDWGGWQPGNTDAAMDRSRALTGAAAGLYAAGGSVDADAQEMASGFVTRMARALVDGLADGDGAVALGAAVFAALSDEGYAGGSVLAQLVVAAGAAAMAVYLAREVQQVRWEVDPSSNVCPECLANAAGSPYRIENAPSLPAHPSCRCSLTPAG